MPEMSGPELVELLKKSRPDMRVMLISGYSGGDLLVLNYGWSYISKPFVAGKLVEMVKNVLRATDRSQSSTQVDQRQEGERQEWKHGISPSSAGLNRR
jgi:DNA-binding NtrC family response regulator